MVHSRDHLLFGPNLSVIYRLNSRNKGHSMNECIFITGAGDGIGRETALLFASRAWFVGAADIDEPALISLKDELGENRCSIHIMDVVDEASVKQGLADFTRQTDGQLRFWWTSYSGDNRLWDRYPGCEAPSF